MSRDNIGMTDLRGRFHFPFKSGDRGIVSRHGSWQHLDRDEAIHSQMPSFIHLPHATCPDFFHQDIVAQN